MVATGDPHGLGYGRVDGEGNVGFLLATMEATSRWDSVRSLRAWERARLGLRPGDRLLDVGCGRGDAALALAADVGPDGEVVGVDASAAMVAVAARLAVGAPSRTRFAVGDAAALDAPDGAFAVVRSERTLQWVADPPAAVAEMVRVLRPGGRLALIDTDWSTLRLDVGDDDLTALVATALEHERGRPSNVGRRLAALARAAGCAVGSETSVVHRWTGWDPDASPAPDGCFSMTSLADDLVATGHLAPGGADGFVATVHAAARAGRFAMTLRMHALVATRP